MASLTLLANDYQALAKEAGRRHPAVREAAELAHQLLKTSKEQALLDLRAVPTPSPQPLYAPVFLAAATRNAKVIALAVSALQRLIAAGAVPQELVKQILETLEQVIPQGVEIQLKILQTLVSLLTTNVGGTGPRSRERLVQGDELGLALELSHRLSVSKIPVVASTASATLRQLFMFVYERVGDEDLLVAAATESKDEQLLAALPPASFNVDVPAPEFDASTHSDGADEDRKPEPSTPITLRPAARDAYLLLEDLCLLVNGAGDSVASEGEPSFLKWGTVTRTFGLELVESIISGFAPVLRSHPELLLVLRAHLCPLLIRFISNPPAPASSTSQFSFPLTVRLTRVAFLLLKQFSDLLPVESEAFLSILIRVIGPGDKGEGEGGHPSGAGAGSSPLWMRVLALEVIRGLSGDFALMIKFYERYDARPGGVRIFSDLMTAFSRIATEKPSALGMGGAITYGSSLAPIPSSSGGGTGATGAAASMLEGAVEMGIGLAQVAGNVVGSSVSSGAPPPGLSHSTANIKLQCIDQLDKADSPPIPETYIFFLALQCLTNLSDGFSSTTLSAYSVILSSRSRAAAARMSEAPAALDWATLDSTDSKVALLLTVKDIAETSWPALLASLSFFVVTALDDDLFTDVVSALRNFASVCGVLGLHLPREAFLTSLCKFSVPPAVVAHLAALDASGPARVVTSVLSAGVDSLGLGPAAPLPVGLSSRNFACLRALISVAQYLAGSLDSIWFAVFETLQNADFVIRSNLARSKKRLAMAAPPATPPRSAGIALSPVASTQRPSAEMDEQSILGSISKLFEVSKNLEDDAFKWFIGSLCRLDGEMIGIPMAVDGTPVESSLTNGMVTPLESAGTSASGSVVGEEPRRRRASGISIIRTLRQGEKSFGITQLGVVAVLNVHRLTYRDPSVGWDLVTSHLLLVQQFSIAPAAIRIQAAEVLDSLLLVSPQNLSTGDHDLNRRIQTQVLVALAAQAEPSSRLQSSVDVDLRRMALETLFKILETNGHSFLAGWEQIFDVLRTACPSPLSLASHSPMVSDTPLPTIGEGEGDADSDVSRPMNQRSLSSYFPDRVARSPVLVRTAFPSLQLVVTDFLEALTIDELRVCISTLAEFGKQTDDVNVALTAGGLLWSISDHLQAKRTDGDNEVAHGELWMFLLHQLLASCQDPRQEVRDGAITTVFRSISTYGATLSKSTWDACMWEIIFPLIDSLTASLYALGRVELEEGEQLAVQVNGPPIRLVDKQWDDSKALALTSMGQLFVDYLPSKILKTPRYDETWGSFIGCLKRSFVEDRPQVATAAMKVFEKVLGVSQEEAEPARISSSAEVAWAAWDEIGLSVAAASLPPPPGVSKTFTQINLEAYVRVALPIYSACGTAFDLARIHRLLSILKDVLTFSRCPDYRPDIDTLTPVQASILEVIGAIQLDVPGAASAVLTDLSEYITLAFIAAFDSEPEAPSRFNSRPSPSQRVTYIALTKEAMSHVLWLFQKYKDDRSIYEQGAVERMLSAYALPIKLKHDCPAPSKYGSDELLWKTATVSFLRGVRDCVASLERFSADISTLHFEGIWRQIIEGFRGALLADPDPTPNKSTQQRHEDENFDLTLLVSLEKDIVPSLGSARVPDDLIKRLGKYLQTASRLYALHLPAPGEPPVTSSRRSSSGDSDSSDLRSPAPTKEARFDTDFDRQARGRLYGTTAEVVEVGRERFGYWCFDMLFQLCSDLAPDRAPERGRIAVLCLPSLLNRCTAVIKTYVADAPLRGKMPFPRVRQEELIFVLQRLLHSKLRECTLWASYQADPTASLVLSPSIDTALPLPVLLRSLLLRSSLAHLYELHPLFTALLSLSIVSPSITSAYIPFRRDTGARGSDNITFKGLPDGFIVGRVGRSGVGETEGDVVKLALACLAKVGLEIGASAAGA